MATVTKPIALDESLHTTETSPRNLADVLDDGLTAIANSYNVTGILPVSNGGTGANNATDAKANIGLGNVPNVTTDNQTPTVTQDSTRSNLATGDTLKTIVGKIKKWFADLGDLAFLNKDGASSTKFLRGDGTWQTVASGVTGVKGNSESSYRTGDVNLTKANIGLGNVDNTSDANKPISTATQTALNGKANTSALTDGSVTKIGTGNVGSATQPVYINGGVPTAGMNFGITTRTPTNINSNLTYRSNYSFIKKSGNVVNFHLDFTVDANFVASSSTKICDLPYLPEGRPLFTRNEGGEFALSYNSVSSKELKLGTAPYTQITQGTDIHIYGTYLTND